jgi:prefoldin subunit 4
MKLLEEGEVNDTQVTWEDQNSINQFSKLNIRLEALDAKYEQKKVGALDIDREGILGRFGRRIGACR